MPKQLQICYFPYIFLNKVKEITFVKINIWNFDLLKNVKIKNDETRENITKLITSNVMNKKPIKGIGIVAFRNNNEFNYLTKKEYRAVDELKKVLFLSSVAKLNIHDGSQAGNYIVTADNFTVIYQNFEVGSIYTAYSTGKMVRVNSGGHKIGEVVYEKPRYVLYNDLSIDEKLFNTLKKIKKKNSQIFRLIVRATDAFMNGYTNSDDVSYEARILEIARAFEILLELPEKEQRKEFKQKISKYVCQNHERKRRYKSERNKGKFISELGARQVMWADRFYTLRNHIIHGEVIKDNDFLFFGQPHYTIALWFFIICVKRILDEKLCEKTFYDTIRYESGKFEYDNQFLRPLTLTEELLKSLQSK